MGHRFPFLSIASVAVLVPLTLCPHIGKTDEHWNAFGKDQLSVAHLSRQNSVERITMGYVPVVRLQAFRSPGESL